MANFKKLTTLCVVASLGIGTAYAQKHSLGAVSSINQIQNDISPAVSSLSPVVGAPAAAGDDLTPDGPMNPYPVPPAPNGPVANSQGIQTVNLPRSQAFSVGSFPGLAIFAGGAGGFIPPDTVGAVGNGQYVQAVNAAFAVFDKNSGAVLAGPVPTKVLWTGFGGNCETHNDGDAIVIYDKIANRWIISQFSITGGTGPMLECVAVSTTADATGSYFRYAFGPFVDSNNAPDFIDYPKMGTWPDAYYATFNAFNANGTAFNGAKICMFDRSSMLVGAPASTQCFGDLGQFYSILPADFDGSVLPAPGTPAYLLEQDATAVSSSVLHFFRVHVDFLNVANTFGTVQDLPVPFYSQICLGFRRGACIPQPPPGPGFLPGNLLESLNFHLMHRAVWRMSQNREELLASSTIAAGARSGIRWYEIRTPNTNPTAYQGGTYAPDSKWRWMPSIAMDKNGNLAVGYSVSDTVSTKPSLAMGGRMRSELRNVLEPEITLWTGTGDQTPTIAQGAARAIHRWGDYSSMEVDPADDCTFYYTNEYFLADHRFSWSTEITKFKFPGCN